MVLQVPQIDPDRREFAKLSERLTDELASDAHTFNLIGGLELDHWRFSIPGSVSTVF